jgi:hypothetical protein
MFTNCITPLLVYAIPGITFNGNLKLVWIQRFETIHGHDEKSRNAARRGRAEIMLHEMCKIRALKSHQSLSTKYNHEL